jgi:hypothetical protein
MRDASHPLFGRGDEYIIVPPSFFVIFFISFRGVGIRGHVASFLGLKFFYFFNNI